MQTLENDNPSKAEELSHWRVFVNDLPPCSYLAMYLKGGEAVLERAMANDESTELVSAIRRNRLEALADESEACKARDKARGERDLMMKEVSNLRGAACKIRAELRELVDVSATLHHTANAAYAKAVNAVNDSLNR